MSAHDHWNAHPGDGKLLTGFVSALDRAIADHGLLPRRGELYHPWIRGCLLEVSDGVIGRISRLVGIALEIALRRGAECIEVYDLALATDRWAVPLGFIAHNPFRRRA